MDTGRPPNIDLMLARLVRRRPDLKPTFGMCHVCWEGGNVDESISDVIRTLQIKKSEGRCLGLCQNVAWVSAWGVYRHLGTKGSYLSLYKHDKDDRSETLTAGAAYIRVFIFY